jgi:hypothetical protein
MCTVGTDDALSFPYLDFTFLEQLSPLKYISSHIRLKKSRSSSLPLFIVSGRNFVLNSYDNFALRNVVVKPSGQIV